MTKTIKIFDTTLRDGEQSPGCSMNLEEKLQVAAQLETMGVDIIEAGFAIASPGDFEAVSEVARQCKRATVASLARAGAADIDRAWEAVQHAVAPRIHTFIATSPLHMRVKLNKTPDEVLEAIDRSVRHARNICPDVEWSAEDATRTEPDFLARAIETAIAAGARTINLPDTVGYATPQTYGAMFRDMIERVPNAGLAVFSTHCHNDLGLAVANTLAAVMSGAGQVESTINGIGERAGNAAVEEIAMALKVRHDVMPYATNVVSSEITRASRLISGITGFQVQPNKAIVGANAFAHESGIHQDGMIKDSSTYEIMTPESVGLTHSNLVMGKHSGRAAFRQKLEELGYTLGDNAFQDAFGRFKALADAKKAVYDEDIVALVDDEVLRGHDSIQVKEVEVYCGSNGPQRAILTLEVDGEEKTVTSRGNGPVDALFNAIRMIVPHDSSVLERYEVHAVTGGTDAQAEVSVLLSENGRTTRGRGTHQDTMVASVRAYVNALNKMMVKRGRAPVDAQAG
ncbi:MULTISPECIES: 2-isopropylmalate synthase [unclassified Sphingomonas]|uniref:2-isopropylmalate synthase n=1 Tax=unclassified Sphingomonas TaxID=196159 RepID=UPI0006F67DF0|nr:MULTISPECIES: 2-isopropylmalate synthase [unclassified Sphingomonas]KQX18447.1 2-isopropylmalate synthase [Sphingomonas sp. Root1294]KQY72227.1 2-isopropylmalate synthase [Sphingomonas sp. Root50]KRB94501.1 2-isopropylmalate synthase [Sphingomonas sp. Root720]